MIELQLAINGILLGGIYSGVAIGLSIMFGILKMVNLAHGDLMILASYFALIIIIYLGTSPFAALIAVAPLMFFIGFLLQKYLFNKLIKRGLEPPLVTALAISIVLQNCLLLAMTPDAQYLSTSIALQTISINEFLSIPMTYLVGFISGVTLIGVLHVFFTKTRTGIAIRAASGDKLTAELMGVNTDVLFSYAMGISMVTAAVCGIIIGTIFIFYPHSGPQYLIIAFGVLIIGGMESLVGTLIGGIILGLAQVLGAHFFGPGYQLLCGYLVLLFLLTLRPRGIFGT